MTNDFDYKFSEGSLKNFKTRLSIDIFGELKSADIAAGEEFKVKFKCIVSENEMASCQIYNVDETYQNHRLLVGMTVKGFKKYKDQLTVLLCPNSSGNHKLNPFIIGQTQRNLGL